MTSFALTPLTTAVTDWENRTGFDFDIVTDVPCTGSRCINIDLALISDCGIAGGSSTDSTGLRTGTQTIQINSSATFTTSGLQRTFAHELGHMLGLEDSDSTNCSVSDAVMQDQFNCEAASVMDDVTINDWTPVNITAYGSGSRLTCGF
jgi:dual-action HEIGH metallo-peptidase